MGRSDRQLFTGQESCCGRHLCGGGRNQLEEENDGRDGRSEGFERRAEEEAGNVGANGLWDWQVDRVEMGRRVRDRASRRRLGGEPEQVHSTDDDELA